MVSQSRRAPVRLRQSLFCHPVTGLLISVIAVYIDSLVMISIERSKTNNKRALEIRDKIFFKGNFFCSQFLHQT